MLNDLQASGSAGEFYTPRAVTAFMVDRIDPKPGEVILEILPGRQGFQFLPTPPQPLILR